MSNIKKENAGKLILFSSFIFSLSILFFLLSNSFLTNRKVNFKAYFKFNSAILNINSGC